MFDIEKILNHQYVPDGKKAKTLEFILNRNTDNLFKVLDAYWYGVMIGKQQERKRRAKP